MAIPMVKRSEQVKQANEMFAGAVLKSVKDEKGLITLEFETIGIMILAEPSAIALGLYQPPKGEKANV